MPTRSTLPPALRPRAARWRPAGAFAFALALALTACSDDGAPSDDASESTASDSSGELECYDLTQNYPEGYIDVLECGLPQPCDTLDFTLNWACENNPNPTTFDPEIAACMIDALASGEAARLEIRDCPGGQYTTTYNVQALGEGTILWERLDAEDLGYTHRLTWRAAPDAAHFQSCSTTDAAAFMDCLGAITAGECQVGEPSCPG